MEENNQLELLLANSCNPFQPLDESLFEEMNLVINQTPDGCQSTLRFLAHKIQSPSERESLQALLVLEKLVQSCGPRFVEEMAKFRFLNEIIKVVSPKYLGHRSSVKVKQKIIELMFLWSIEIKEMPKIFEAYQMLKKQGIVTEDPVHVIPDYKPPTPPPPRPKDEVFDDEENSELLRRLLQSGKPEDLLAANKLIKSLAKEADKRMDFKARFQTEIETVYNNCKVLSDMLSHYVAGETSNEEKELMKELYESCEKLRLRIFKLANEIVDKNDPNMGQLFNANDELSQVINRYNKTFGISNKKDDENKQNLIEIFQESMAAKDSATNADVALLDDHLSSLTNSDNAKRNAIEDLDSVFNSLKSDDPLFDSDILVPAQLNKKLSKDTKRNEHSQPTLEELDALSRDMLRQNISCAESNKVGQQQNAKLSLNDLQKQTAKKSENSSPENKNDLPPPLTDVVVLLDSIEPSTLAPLALYDKNDIKVNLHFAKNTPRTDITVMVVIVTSVNKNRVSQVSFLAAVPKSMRVKLQPASGNCLVPYNAFLPPATITQVMLVARNNSSEKVKLRYKFSYSINNVITTETGEVDSLFDDR